MYRRSLANILLVAALGALGPTLPPVIVSPQRDPPRRKALRNQGYNRYTPHQGPRECQRRRMGGFFTAHSITSASSPE